MGVQIREASCSGNNQETVMMSFSDEYVCIYTCNLRCQCPAKVHSVFENLDPGVPGKMRNISLVPQDQKIINEVTLRTRKRVFVTEYL